MYDAPETDRENAHTHTHPSGIFYCFLCTQSMYYKNVYILSVFVRKYHKKKSRNIKNTHTHNHSPLPFVSLLIYISRHCVCVT